MSDRLRMFGVFGAGFALGVVLAWTAPPAPTSSEKKALNEGMAGPPPMGQAPGVGDPSGPAHPGKSIPAGAAAPEGKGDADLTGGGHIGEVPHIQPKPLPEGFEEPPKGTDWLEQHLDTARSFWEAQAAILEGDPTHASLAAQARRVAAAVPVQGDLPPPLPEVAMLMVREMEMLDAMRAAGVDVTAVEAELQHLDQLR